MRYIISTIGTSTLTNSINRTTEGHWFGILGASANLKEGELPAESKDVIDTLAERACEKLNQNEIETHRRASAELNGIYGIYDNTLPTDSRDQHYLICTDTFQGQTTGELIKDFLEQQGFNASVEIPKGLSTKDTDSFTGGTKELIKWLEENVSWQQDSVDHQVIFNLVGGFKSLQGYMQTFGTFYADESVYIFEGSSELIKIPRLPIQIDTTVIEEHTLKFAMMAAGEMYPIEELEGIPETLLEPIEDNGKTVAGLSAWGDLIWNRTKSDLISDLPLLDFPRLQYRSNFLNDIKPYGHQLLDLQETLAKISVELEKNGGNTNPVMLNEELSGMNFEKLTNHNRLYTFRINDNFRVSYQVNNGNLELRRYGAHNAVYRKP